MGVLKEKVQGRADMAVVSSRVKSRLSSGWDAMHQQMTR
jgi:hypothetical protein